MRVKEAGISFVFPKDWTPRLWTRSTARLEVAANPDAGTTVKELLAEPFVALWDADGDEYPDRWMVVGKESVSPAILAAPTVWRAASVRSGLEDVIVKRTKVAGRPALRVSAVLHGTRDDGNPHTSYMSQFAFAAGDEVITVNFYGLVPLDREYDQMIQTVVDSLKFL